MLFLKTASPKPVSSWVQTLTHTDPERVRLLSRRPLAEQDVLGAICCVSVEVAQIANSVSNPALAQVKLQWWVDLLEGKGDIPVGHPLGKAILFLQDHIGLHRGEVIPLIEARQDMILFTEVPVSTEEFVSRSRSYGKALMDLFLKGLYTITPLSQTIEVKKGLSLQEAAAALGTLWEVGMQLRYMVDRWGRGKQDMPMGFLQHEGIDPLKPLDRIMKQHPDGFARAFRRFATDTLKQTEGKMMRSISFPSEMLVLEKMRERLLFIFTVLRHAKRLPLPPEAFTPPWFLRFMGR